MLRALGNINEVKTVRARNTLSNQEQRNGREIFAKRVRLCVLHYFLHLSFRARVYACVCAVGVYGFDESDVFVAIANIASVVVIVTALVFVVVFIDADAGGDDEGDVDVELNV